MIKSNDQKLLDNYLLKYNISSYFSTDMTPYMELLLFKRSEYICKIDECIDALYFFVEGKAKVYTTLSNGKSLLLCFYKPMMVIGDAEILESNTASTNLQVIEDTYCISINFKHIRQFAIDDSKFLRYMNSSLGSKLLRLSKYSSINILYPLENRLASYLLVILSAQGSDLKDNHNLTEIAELLGTSYRHLLRTLNKLTHLGAIRKNQHFYEIDDYKLLKTMASDLYD
jgi:CRP/FNR family transcriptional regulator, putaive post-exponential-phase nitrogen-starvation regulator